MRAVRYVEAGRNPEIVDVLKPSPGPGQVLIRIAGAGVCHSDLHILDHGLGALDFVGSQPTIDLCARTVGRASRLTIVGLAGGTLSYAMGSPPFGCEVSIPYWGSRIELMEVIALAAAGHINADVERFPLENAVDVYQRLRNGKIMGRAVLVP